MDKVGGTCYRVEDEGEDGEDRGGGGDERALRAHVHEALHQLHDGVEADDAVHGQHAAAAEKRR